MGMGAARMMQGLGQGIDRFQDSMRRAQFNIAQRAEKKAANERYQNEWQYKVREDENRRLMDARRMIEDGKRWSSSQRRLDTQERNAAAANIANIARQERQYNDAAPEREARLALLRAQANSANALAASRTNPPQGQGGRSGGPVRSSMKEEYERDRARYQQELLDATNPLNKYGDPQTATPQHIDNERRRISQLFKETGAAYQGIYSAPRGHGPVPLPPKPDKFGPYEDPFRQYMEDPNAGLEDEEDDEYGPYGF